MLTQRELKKMAELHERWKECRPGGQYADFSDMELTHLDFEGMDFEAASFRGARIFNCCMCGNFTSANFRGALLRNVFASYSLYENADFTDTNCWGCNFTHTKFDGAHMRRADFGDSDLTGAVLECCDLTGAKLDDVIFSYTATAGSWGDTPPARDAETFAAEAKFTAAMLGLGYENTGKISEWRDEAWSQAQDQSCGCEPKPGPREPEYRELLARYADVFTQARAQFPAETEALYQHGEEFSPEELHAAAAQLAEGYRMETVRNLQCQGLLRPENADELAYLNEAVGRFVEDALAFPEAGEIRFDMDMLRAFYGFGAAHEFCLSDMLLDREELADAWYDHDADAFVLKAKPEFLHGMTMMMQ